MTTILISLSNAVPVAAAAAEAINSNKYVHKCVYVTKIKFD